MSKPSAYDMDKTFNKDEISEIRTRFRRRSGDVDDMILVLSELYVCSKSCIRKLLIDEGLITKEGEPVKEPKSEKQSNRMKWTEENVKRLQDYKKCGLSASAIADKFGTTPTAVSAAIAKFCKDIEPKESVNTTAAVEGGVESYPSTEATVPAEIQDLIDEAEANSCEAIPMPIEPINPLSSVYHKLDLCSKLIDVYSSKEYGADLDTAHTHGAIIGQLNVLIENCKEELGKLGS